MQRRHELPFALKRDLVKPRLMFLQFSLAITGLCGCGKQRTFGGVPKDLPAFSAFTQNGIVAEHGDAQKAHQFRVIARLYVLALGCKAARRFVTAAGDRQMPFARPYPPHGHLVKRKRTGLVGADDCGSAEGLDSSELSYDDITFGHAADADGQHYRDGSGKTLRDP